MIVYSNGNWVAETQAVVPFLDQGFLFGKNLFETIRVNQSRPFRLAKHLERLKSGMEITRLQALDLLDVIPVLLQEFIRKNNTETALVRIIVTAGVAPASGENVKQLPALYISSRPVTAPEKWPVPILYVEEKNYPVMRFNPAIKSGNYLGNMLARQDAEAAGAFEPIFINRSGFVTEGAIRNIFYIKDKVLITPSTDLGVLPGVMRDTVMELAHQRDMKVEEGKVSFADVNRMDEAFLSSTGVGILPVAWEGFTSHYELSLELKTELETLFESGAMDVS